MKVQNPIMQSKQKAFLHVTVHDKTEFKVLIHRDHLLYVPDRT